MLAELPNFMQAIERNRASLDYHQFWRYTKAGRLPRIIRWLADNPELAQALADDAAALAQKQTSNGAVISKKHSEAPEGAPE
jgi:hypothetical protein